METEDKPSQKLNPNQNGKVAWRKYLNLRHWIRDHGRSLA